MHLKWSAIAKDGYSWASAQRFSHRKVALVKRSWKNLMEEVRENLVSLFWTLACITLGTIGGTFNSWPRWSAAVLTIMAIGSFIYALIAFPGVDAVREQRSEWFPLHWGTLFACALYGAAAGTLVGSWWLALICAVALLALLYKLFSWWFFWGMNS